MKKCLLLFFLFYVYSRRLKFVWHYRITHVPFLFIKNVFFIFSLRKTTVKEIRGLDETHKKIT